MVSARGTTCWAGWSGNLAPLQQQLMGRIGQRFKQALNLPVKMASRFQALADTPAGAGHRATATPTPMQMARFFMSAPHLKGCLAGAAAAPPLAAAHTFTGDLNADSRWEGEMVMMWLWTVRVAVRVVMGRIVRWAETIRRCVLLRAGGG